MKLTIIPRLGFVCLVALVLARSGSLARAQIKDDQQAAILLNTARKAYNDQNYTFATAKFREFLGKYGGHKTAPAARYGLALALIEGPEQKYEEARDLLQALAATKDFADRAFAGYYAGIALRGMGLRNLSQAQAKPQEAAKWNADAKARFAEAIPAFTSAITTLLARVENPTDGDKLTLDAEWVARARCDLAEMQLRAGKPKDAQASALVFVGDPLWTKSRYKNLGRYYHGYASVLLKDNVAGQKTLSLLAPFDDDVFGNHARYLLARTHHLADERAEATANYEGTIADYAKAKTDAINLLKQPQKFKNDPRIRARLEALVKESLPDHVARATFYLGVLHYEGGKFVDAKTRFAEFVKQQPQSPLRIEAEIRFGYCEVQMKEYGPAIKTLAPLVDRDPRLSDQVLFWLGKAQAGAAPDEKTNKQAHDQAINTALNTLRSASDRAKNLGDKDPDAKTRRGEIQLEIADQMQRIRQNKEAAAVYNQLLNDKILIDREEEIMQRWTSALHLAGDYNGSDAACVKFQERFPQSTLLPAVLFAYAENSYFRILAAEKNPNQAERAKQIALLFDETATRFRKVIEKYPEFPKIQVARYSLGLTLYRKGDLPGALKALSSIPLAERGGDLGLTSFLIADCHLRQTPSTVPDDALAAGKMEEQLKAAADALGAFISGQPKDENVPDALLKLGLCQQRLASLVAQPAERAKKFQEARATYDRIMKEFSKRPSSVAHALFERAKCIAQSGDMNGGINDLRKFTSDPLKQTAAAPQAILQLATYLRAQNNAKEAVEVFAKNRDFLESHLAKDQKNGQTMIALLRYHHGVALREHGKLPEARSLFDSVVKMGLQRIEATEAALRIGQCLKEEGQQRLQMASKVRSGGTKPEEIANAQRLTQEGYKFIRDAATYLEAQAEQGKGKAVAAEARGRMLYEAAWCARLLSESEIEGARAAAIEMMRKKLNASSKNLPLPEVAIDKLPLQPSEKRARDLYKRLIDQAGDIALATEARFELAELLAQRNEHDAAVQLLNEVLDKEPGLDLTEKVRLRMGGIHAAKGNIKGALQQFDAVASNTKSPLLGWAHYRAGEVLIQNQQYPEAIKRLMILRDHPSWNNVAGLTDRGLLRLGYAYALTKSWDESRGAYERIVNQFPNSASIDDARYGIGWALQQQKNYDGAASAYSQVVARTATELAAKAQLQIGLCRVEQKRFLDAANAFLVIPSTYDYPELRAAALFEAGKAYVNLNQPRQATRQFERLVREFPNTPWADAAKEKLGQK
ncbi:MAG: tetratricopeptide repeat protein [Planctomycetes bacterium]|nr:tetratricopeptide repeat protein [Planctomycetota bacterium]